tara:strand:+ start:32 stop:412 length:381 start_codon:yes stop_codon:yes gene_type:complete
LALIKTRDFSYFWTYLFLIAFAISCFGLFSTPQQEPQINLPDKFLHFLMFLILSYLLTKSNNFHKFSLIFILSFASLSELIQFFLPLREGDLIDLFFNLLGIGVIYGKKFFSTKDLKYFKKDINIF